MLKQADNQLLTQVGPGTPMGDLMRRYWHPVAASKELAESPFRTKGLRILGPAAAPLARLKREHRFQFLLKSPKRSLLAKILGGAMTYLERKEIPETAVLVDMDPLSLM